MEKFGQNTSDFSTDFSPWYPNSPLNNTFQFFYYVYFLMLSGWSNLNRFISVLGHPCTMLTAVPCPLTKLLLLLAPRKQWREDPKAHGGSLQTRRCWVPEAEDRLAPTECHGLRASPNTSRMLNSSRRRTTAKVFYYLVAPTVSAAQDLL